MTNEHTFPHDFGMVPSKGLTKHEYIAIQIYARLCGNIQEVRAMREAGDDPFERWARMASKAADALLEELE